MANGDVKDGKYGDEPSLTGGSAISEEDLPALRAEVRNLRGALEDVKTGAKRRQEEFSQFAR